MSGVLGVLAAGAPASVEITLTQAGGLVGQVTLKTVNIREITGLALWQHPTGELILQLDGEHFPQSYFSRLLVPDGAGQLQAYTTASADQYLIIGNPGAQWYWNTTIWSSADVGETKVVSLVF